jgi:hypothetical protein
MAYIAFFAPEKQDIEKVSRHIKLDVQVFQQWKEGGWW